MVVGNLNNLKEKSSNYNIILMASLTVPFIELKECFLKWINFSHIKGNKNIDEVASLIKNFIEISWNKYFPEKPEIKVNTNQDGNSNCIFYNFNLVFEDAKSKNCFEILEKSKRFAEVIEIIIQPYRKRVKFYVLCDHCQIPNEENEKMISVLTTTEIPINDMVSITVKDKDGQVLETVLGSDYYFDELPNLNKLLENIKSLGDEKLIESIRELLVSYGNMVRDCNMCTAYRLLEVLEILTKKFNFKWGDLEAFFDKKVVPEYLKNKSLENIIGSVRHRMNKPLSELSSEERHAKVKTTSSKKTSPPPLTSQEICKVMKELLKAFLKKVNSILED
jgi:hypothetical protein